MPYGGGKGVVNQQELIMYLDYDINKGQFICFPEIFLYLSQEEIEEIENDRWDDNDFLDWTKDIVEINPNDDNCPF